MITATSTAATTTTTTRIKSRTTPNPAALRRARRGTKPEGPRTIRTKTKTKTKMQEGAETARTTTVSKSRAPWFSGTTMTTTMTLAIMQPMGTGFRSLCLPLPLPSSMPTESFTCGCSAPGTCRARWDRTLVQWFPCHPTRERSRAFAPRRLRGECRTTASASDGGKNESNPQNYSRMRATTWTATGETMIIAPTTATTTVTATSRRTARISCPWSTPGTVPILPCRRFGSN
mmetsp:Transcript_14872/g.41410  ORF Transcript_14872/g.41410 Transcript_14872/m.41410 type:complete len:232 (+) Transcript_14872:409-1104(+)